MKFTVIFRRVHEHWAAQRITHPFIRGWKCEVMFGCETWCFCVNIPSLVFLIIFFFHFYSFFPPYNHLSVPHVAVGISFSLSFNKKLPISATRRWSVQSLHDWLVLSLYPFITSLSLSFSSLFHAILFITELGCHEHLSDYLTAL